MSPEMTTVTLSDRERDGLRAFRRVAADTRVALATLAGREHKLRVIDGYIEEEGWRQSYRLLCVPVRRAFLAQDKASFLSASKVVSRADNEQLLARANVVTTGYRALLLELDGSSSIGGERVNHGFLFRSWLDAAIFYDHPDKCRPYENLVEEYGKAIESIAVHLTEDMAARIVELDEVVADFLHEPRGVTPSPTPPPPAPSGWRAWLKTVPKLIGNREAH